METLMTKNLNLYGMEERILLIGAIALGLIVLAMVIYDRHGDSKGF